VALILALPRVAFARDAARSPSIVLILADNVGVGEVGSCGRARGVQRPSLDRFAKEGLRLTDFKVE
jgi:arylsulfatase A-like enzyme